MDLPANGDAINVVGNGVNQSTDLSGWLFRFIQEGWLRKRWRKRWCVLKQDRLLLYEFEPKKADEKPCGKIELENFHKCVHAPKKECKKSPNTFTLELPKPEEKTNQKSKSTAKREIFYSEKEADGSRWIEQLNDKIAAARLGYAKALDHVTKARPKPPSAQRRPPSRQHLRDRAEQSEISSGFDVTSEVKAEPVKRGHVPTSAIKPPPGAVKPKSDQVDSTALEESNEAQQLVDEPPPGKTSSKPPMKPKVSVDEEAKLDNASPAKLTSNKPPPAPSKALKPKLSIDEDAKSDKTDAKVAAHVPPPAPSKALKPKLTVNEDTDQDNANSPIKVMPGTPPPAPLKALKPKLANLPLQEVIIEEEPEKDMAIGSSYPSEENEILIAEAIVSEEADENSNHSQNKEEEIVGHLSVPSETLPSLHRTNEDETDEAQPPAKSTPLNESTADPPCDDTSTGDLAETEKSTNVPDKSEVDVDESEVHADKSEVDVDESEVHADKSEVDVDKSQIDANKSEVDVTKTEVDLNKTSADKERTE